MEAWNQHRQAVRRSLFGLATSVTPPESACTSHGQSWAASLATVRQQVGRPCICEP